MKTDDHAPPSIANELEALRREYETRDRRREELFVRAIKAGYSASEIAEFMNISKTTVGTILQRAGYTSPHRRGWIKA